ncbi:antigen 5 like allergen Cul n 1 [Drosophila ficusphila]|uniref:antigen 5 like allergen Cul n 1 n=1 Tax=Drosophila ficusphila TaxID=30025 RepID=UPI0007E7C1A5|nr:antigen 5 like allergen Cul n 1 [Drosophila ficusphila]
MKMWSCVYITAGLLFFSTLKEVDLKSDTDFCQIKNCPNGTEMPHIACNHSPGAIGVLKSVGRKLNIIKSWSSHCGKKPTIIAVPEKMMKFILNYHNTYRDLVAGSRFHRLPNAGRMLKMKWDSELAHVAEVLVKRCDLQPTKHCISTEEFASPGYNSVYNKFKRNEDGFKIVRSQLNAWYDEYKHVSPSSLIYGLSSEKKEIGHFLRMMVGPSNRLGCASARTEKDGFTHQWLTCLYSCSPENNSMIYQYAAKPGLLCTTGVDAKFQHLCSSEEPVENCKPSSLTNTAIPTDTVSLIRSMAINRGQAKKTLCGFCARCCDTVDWAKGSWSQIKNTLGELTEDYF